MSNNDNRSRLTGSSSRPSNNPYDTPLERGNNATSDVGSGGYRHSPPIDPTPNSLNEQTGRVRFSRAEYKPDAMRQQASGSAPNSMQNSLQGSYNPPPSSGAFYHEQFPVSSWEDPMTQRSAHRHTHHPLEGHYDATESEGTSSARLSAALTRHREENMSSLQRYAEIKHNRRSLSPRERTFRSDGEKRSGRDRRYSSSMDDSRGRATSRERNFNDDSSTMTPMERWESRKERKARERDGRGSSKERIADRVNRREKERDTSNSSLGRGRSLERLESIGAVSSSGRSDRSRESRAVTPAQHTVAKDRASRWSPQEDYDTPGRPQGQSRECLSRKAGEWGGGHIDTRPDPSGDNMTPQGWARKTHDDRHSPLYDEEGDSMKSTPIGQASPLSIDPLEDDLLSGQNRRESTYADDLASFTQSITSSVVKKHADMQANYSQIEEGSRSQAPEIAVPVHVMPDAPKDGNESVRTIEVTRASALCSRFTRRGRGQGEGAADKSKTWCIVTTMAAFFVCIIGAGVAIWYIGRLQKVIDIAESSGNVSSDGSDSAPPSTSAAPSLSPTYTPTMSPTATKTSQPSTQREADIGQYLSMLSHGKTNNAGSPQYKAKSWLLHEDPLNLFLPFDDLTSLADGGGYEPSLTARRIIQRYTLATIYYSMGIGEGGVVQGWLLGDECGGSEGDTGAWGGLDCHANGAVRTLALGE